MRLAIMQPYLFPYIGYFQAIHSVDKYILYENLDYIKDGWMHRNRILIKQGKPNYISAQLEGKSSNKKISEIHLNSSSGWRRKLKNAIFLNYKGAPYFEEIYALIDPLIDYKTESLHEYSSHGIKEVCEYLNFKTKVVSNNDDYLPLEKELDDLYALGGAPDIPKKVLRVINMCHREKAKAFINAIGGRVLYDKALFKEHGISLSFIQSDLAKYPQFADEFHPGLSIIDVLMHNGRENTLQLIEKYTLV